MHNSFYIIHCGIKCLFILVDYSNADLNTRCHPRCLQRFPSCFQQFKGTRLWSVWLIWAWKLLSIFMHLPFEEWWRGIKCYPCPLCVRPSVRPCVRPSVIKIWCPLNNFWKLHRFNSNLVCWYIISKHRSSSIWVTILSFLTELWAFYKNIVQKLVSAQLAGGIRVLWTHF